MPVAGNENTGQFSINRRRESAKGFFLTRASVQETVGRQAGNIPNLDSIASGTYFDVMGLRPVLGRLIGPQDDNPKTARFAEKELGENHL